MAVTMEQLQQELAALKAQVDGITAPPTDYYTSRWSGEEIDNGVARALPGGAIDTALDGKLSTNLGGVAGKFDVLDGVYKAGDYVWLDETGEIGVTGALYILRVAAPQYGPHPATQQTLLQAYPVMPNANIRIRTHYYAGGWTPWQQLANTANLCNPNLLDNWYFVGGGGPGQFPVNQRGVSAGTAGWSDYFIDRYLGQCTYKLLPEGLEIQAGGYLVQRLDILPPLPATYAFLATTGLWFVTFTQYGATAIPGIGFAELNQSDKYIALKTDTPLALQAQKLELGSIQTLAHQEGGKWVLNEIPNYAEQLARCQRYQLTLGNNSCCGYAESATLAYMFVPLPVTMRTTPAFSGRIQLYPVDGNTVTSTSVISASSNMVCIGLAGTGFALGKVYSAYIVSGILDANL